MTKFVIIRGGVGGVHLARREAWRDEPRHAREGSTLHRCCGVAIPADARRKRDLAACDTARDQRIRRRVLLGWRRCSGFHGASLTTVLTAVGAQTANRINSVS